MKGDGKQTEGSQQKSLCETFKQEAKQKMEKVKTRMFDLREGEYKCDLTVEPVIFKPPDVAPLSHNIQEGITCVYITRDLERHEHIKTVKEHTHPGTHEARYLAVGPYYVAPDGKLYMFSSNSASEGSDSATPPTASEGSDSATPPTASEGSDSATPPTATHPQYLIHIYDLCKFHTYDGQIPIGTKDIILSEKITNCEESTTTSLFKDIKKTF